MKESSDCFTNTRAEEASTARTAPAEDLSVDAAKASVLTEADGIFTLREKQKSHSDGVFLVDNKFYS